MKRDPNNPEELRQEILYRAHQGEMFPWAGRAANSVMRIAGRILLAILTVGRVWSGGNVV